MWECVNSNGRKNFAKKVPGFFSAMTKDDDDVGLPPVNVGDLQASLFSPTLNSLHLHRQDVPSTTFFNNFLVKTSSSEIVAEEGHEARVARLREVKDLIKDQVCPTPQAPRWPAECQVVDGKVEHIVYNPPTAEQYYNSHGNEAQPKPLGDEFGTVVYQYYPVSAINYFNRSCTRGNKFYSVTPDDIDYNDLRFESRFESGNLAKAIKLTSTFYELYVHSDMYTNKHAQWFYFRINNIRKNHIYRFSIVNLSKGESLYRTGMRPLMYSTKDAKLHSIGWRRCGENIAYFSNENGSEEEGQSTTYTLSFTIEFPHDFDEVYLAHSYPYTYSDLQDYLITLVHHPIKSLYSSLRLLCRTLAGNNVYYLTITSPHENPDIRKKGIVLTARVHPGESPSSWIMKGILDFLTTDSGPARELRDKFIFKIVPMLNPDGVIVGNSRCSLTGRDLNRQYRTVIRETYPSIWYTKLMVRRLIEECGVAMYCDVHAHSRQNNIFVYGCENRRGYDRYLQEQVFPLMLHKNCAEKFSFENCKFRVQKAKEGTGRVVMWMMGISNSYTLEASFAGSELGPREYTHFSIADYEQMGRTFCQTLLDFYDDNPTKEKLRTKIWKKLLKEGSTADEPTNINISDYSSEEGETSSSDEGAGTCDTHPFSAPPPSPNFQHKTTKKKSAASAKGSSAKSPVTQRRILPMYQATLGFSIGESTEETEETETDLKSPQSKLKRFKPRKILRKKKSKKCTVKELIQDVNTDEKSDKKKSKNISVMNITPPDRSKISSGLKHSHTGFPSSKVNDLRNSRIITKQLNEVQAKLFTLRRKIWNGTDNIYAPLSWGYSCFSTSTLAVSPTKEKVRKEPKDASPNRKPRNLNEFECDKKNKKKKKKIVKEETKSQNNTLQGKKKSSGLKRQSAVECQTPIKRPIIIKSKSVQESKIKVAENNKRFASFSEVSVEVQDFCKKANKKKKKRKETRITALKNIKSLIRKLN